MSPSWTKAVLRKRALRNAIRTVVHQNATTLCARVSRWRKFFKATGCNAIVAIPLAVCNAINPFFMSSAQMIAIVEQL
uniref:Uncharacterized protein n=1 Tax=Parascaris univalens TaxID=6257 RepID=A0A914ZKX5_PARUN